MDQTSGADIKPEPMDWDSYYAHRNKLDGIRIDQAASFDKSILTLSSGALALSLVLMEKFQGAEAANDRTFLVTSWAFFVLAIAGNVLSYSLSSKAAEKEIENLDRRMREEDWVGVDRNFIDEMTRFVNSLSGVAFTIGAICLLAYAYMSGL